MRFLPYFMDLIPVDNTVEAEIVEKSSVWPMVLIVAVVVVVAVCLIAAAIKKNKK